MATLQVENLPDELYRSIQSLSAARSVTLNDAVIQLQIVAWDKSLLTFESNNNQNLIEMGVRTIEPQHFERETRHPSPSS
ncbi:MAG: hypothetical protein WA885_18210 [Phormidesmis sp.]